MKYSALLSLAALVSVAACGSESPTEVSSTLSPSREIVITEGTAAPTQAPKPRKPSLSVATAEVSMGGSTTTPLSLTPQSCSETAAQTVVVTYTLKNNQANAASFKVNTRWEFDGADWTGSVPVTVSVPAQAGGSTKTFQVTVTVANVSGAGTGTSSFSIAPFDLSTSGAPALQVNNANVTVNVVFGGCAVLNTAPTLVMPDDITNAEATSSAGAAVTFVVTATDLQDGDLTTTGGFHITVVDTTPAYFTSFPTGTVNLIAADINGATLDVESLGITAADVGGVSEPSTFSCDYVAGTVLEIGSTTTVWRSRTWTVLWKGTPSR